MRTIGSLVVLFLVAGLIIPFIIGANYGQNSVDTNCVCVPVDPNLQIPCSTFSGDGYLFMTYVVNLYIERSGTRIPSCTDQLQTNTNHSFSFMTWPA